MSYVKAKLSNIEEQRLAARIDQLEAQNREHDKTIKSLERRNDTMEQFVRNKSTPKIDVSWACCVTLVMSHSL